MTERRRHFRRRTLLNGRLEIKSLNGWRLDCPVRNVSEMGARLAIPSDIVVPQRVSLAISDGAQRPAELIWYREGHAGFALSERRALPRTTPALDVAATQTPVAATRLEARIAAIAGRDPADRPHFTGI